MSLGYLTKKLKSKFTAEDLKVLRLVKGVTRRDSVRNAEMKHLISSISETIQTDQLRWFGHMMRRAEKPTAKESPRYKSKRKKT